MESDQQMLQETYRLSKENNQMLHSMRRNAFWGGIVKMIIYAAFLLFPVWLYFQYLAPIMNQALKTMQQMQASGTQATAQISGFQQMLQDLQAKLPH
jgi:hypothetical protein